MTPHSPHNPNTLSVVFNFLGRDFFNAMSERDVEGFQRQLLLYLAGFGVGIPIIVFADYFQVRVFVAHTAYHKCYCSRACYFLYAVCVLPYSCIGTRDLLALGSAGLPCDFRVLGCT